MQQRGVEGCTRYPVVGTLQLKRAASSEANEANVSNQSSALPEGNKRIRILAYLNLCAAEGGRGVPGTSQQIRAASSAAKFRKHFDSKFGFAGGP